MDVNFEKIFAIIVLRFVPMQFILIKREFEDENFMDSKVTKKSAALKTVAYNMVILYSGNFLRTINFAVFVDSLLPRKLIFKNIIIAYKCNDSLVNPQNLICKMV